MNPVLAPPTTGDDWFGLSDAALPVADAWAWLVRPDSGGQVVFTGTVRDQAEGRTGVEWLEYEAYTEQVVSRMEAVAAEMRRRWPTVGRIALLHRTGRLALGEVAVVVGVGAPHRDEAFAAARFGIDAVKASVPIWKKESWEGGEAWGADAQTVTPVGPQAGNRQ
jgi:molybdopterin synthase catalytic subunit